MCFTELLSAKVIISIQIDVTYCKTDILWGNFLASGFFFFCCSFATQEATVTATNNLLFYGLNPVWIFLLLFPSRLWLSKQNNVQSAGEVKQHLMLVSWQAIYRKRSGLLIRVIYAIAASTVDFLSNSSNLRELGKLTPNNQDTAQRLAFHTAPFHLVKFVLSVEMQPKGFRFTYLWPLYLILYELWIQMKNLNDDHIFACKLWTLSILCFNFCLSRISQQQLLNV